MTAPSSRAERPQSLTKLLTSFTSSSAFTVGLEEFSTAVRTVNRRLHGTPCGKIRENSEPWATIRAGGESHREGAPPWHRLAASATGIHSCDDHPPKQDKNKTQKSLDPLKVASTSRVNPYTHYTRHDGGPIGPDDAAFRLEARTGERV